MEDRHKRKIQTNYLTLINNVNTNELLPRLIQRKVFSRDQAEKYKETFRKERDRNRDLFMDIQRRGPHAFNKLIESLREIDKNHKHLASLLADDEEQNLTLHNNNYDDNNENDFETNDKLVRLSPPENKTSSSWPFKLTEEQRPSHIRQISMEAPNSNINLGMEPLSIRVRKSTRYYDDMSQAKVPIYPMRSQQRGLFLCINNIEFVNNTYLKRKGAEVDEENMKTLFKDIGFNVYTVRNQSLRDMKRTIENFTSEEKNPRLRQVDCVVVSVMSHGEEGHTKESSQIVSHDAKLLDVSWILEQFSNLYCPALINKPKIFLFQICRGLNPNPGVRVEPRRIECDGIFNGRTVRCMDDMLIGFSTLPGDKSFRDTHLGTWYIQTICKIFMEHAHDTDIENLLKMVDMEMKDLKSDDGNMQTSSFENRGFKTCYLHPGLPTSENINPDAAS